MMRLSIFHIIVVVFLLPAMIFSANLSTVSVTPNNQNAGATTYHTIGFTTVTEIPVDGYVVIHYPAGADFDLTSVNVATITTPAMDGTLSVVSADADSVVLQRSGISNVVSTSVVGIRLYHVENTETADDYHVLVNTEDNTRTILDWSYSSDFTINLLSLNAFTIGNVADGDAGDNFSFVITAVDIYGNTITGFNQTVDITLDWSTTNTTITSGAFVSGTRTQVIGINRSGTVTATVDDGSGHTGVSNSFDVSSGSLNSFTLGSISSPQTAGTGFSVRMTGYDVYGNIATGFNGTVEMDWGSGSKTSSSFTNGEMTEPVTITTSGTNITIDIDDGSGHTASSNAFTVNPLTVVDSFTVGNVSDGEAGDNFTFVLTAVDIYGNTVMNFTDQVDITLNWTSSSTTYTSGYFVGGSCTEVIGINTAGTITAIIEDEDGNQGTSNRFEVSPGDLDHLTIGTITSPQTAGTGFSVSMTAYDVYGNVDTDFNDTVEMDWGGGSKTSSSFTNGELTEPVTITTSGTNITIEIDDGSGHTASSNAFTVNPLNLSAFTIGNVADGVAGDNFSFVITAVDIYGNTITSFNQTVDITLDWSTTNTTITSGAFVSGTRTQVIGINRSGTVTATVDDGSGHTGVSNSFDVSSGSLNSFTLGSISSPQTAGTGFSVRMTGYDVYGNIATGFNGTVEMDWGSGSKTSSSFTNGEMTEPVTITTSGTNITIDIDDGSGHTASSNAFTVNPQSVSKFTLTHSASVSAGQTYTLGIVARDVYNNVATGFTGTVTINWGTGSRTTTNFVLGTHNESGLSLTEAGTVDLSVRDASSHEGLSSITVLPLAIDHFVVDHIASQNAGTPFSIHIEARDEYDNIATTYTGTGRYVNIDWGTGSENSATFSSGQVNQSITIDEAQESVQIEVQDVNDISLQGVSNLFNVIPGPLARFQLNTIGSQISGQPFSISLTALDAQDNIATSFTGTVDITDASATLNAVSGNFEQGHWTGVVTVNSGYLGNTITVEVTGGGISATSNSFDVVAPPGIRTHSFTSARETATTGQADDLDFTLVLENLSGSNARLDSVRFKYLKGGVLQTDYIDNQNTVFQMSGDNILYGNSVDTLIVNLSQIGLTAGDVDIQGDCYFWDPITGKAAEFVAPFTGIQVQTPADIKIQQILASKKEVTLGQTDWLIDVVVKNSGGSTVDYSQMDLSILFGLGNASEWDVEVPEAFHGGNIQMEGGEVDTLNFVINETEDSETGSCSIDVVLNSGVEVNTGRVIDITSDNLDLAEVLVEEPPYLEIVDVVSLAQNVEYVNANQEFVFNITLANTGGDGVHDIEFSIESNYSTPSQRTTFDTDIDLSALAGGETKTVQISAIASSLPIGLEQVTIQYTGLSDNGVSAPFYSNAWTSNVVVQSAIDIEVLGMIASEDTVLGGQSDPWTIEVTVRNMGEAEALLNTPSASDLSFEIDGIALEDFSIKPPTKIQGRSNLLLPGETSGVLVYNVMGTGTLGGQLRAKAVIGATDQNDGLTNKDSLSANLLQVKADPKLRILSTRIEAYHQTDAGNAYVNTNQSFSVTVLIENGLRKTLKDIVVQLDSDGNSLKNAITSTIDELSPNSRDSLSFSIRASSSVRISGEKFTATILEAMMGTDSDEDVNAPIGPAIDGTAVAYIQSPAVVSMTVIASSSTVSTGQHFTVEAILHNTGSAGVDTTGQVRISIPTNYQLGSETSLSVADITTASSYTWTLIAPNSAQNKSYITVSLDQIPNDLNTGEAASVVTGSDNFSLPITTIQSWITASLSLSDPAGAVDQTVSTGQTFIVNAEVYTTENVINAVAQITLPDGYTTKDSEEKSVLSNRVSWQVKAPDVATAISSIQISIIGEDDFQEDVTVSASPVSIDVTAIEKANLSLDLSVEDGSVSLGQAFDVQVHVTNLGLADTVGITQVTLESIPGNYSTSDVLTKTLIDGYATWTIQAPNELTQEAVSIEATLSQIPLDENTNEAAYVSKASDQVAITTVGTWLSVIQYTRTDTGSGLLIPGENMSWLMSLGFINRGEEGANGILLRSLKLGVYNLDGEALVPSEIFEEISVVEWVVKSDTAYFNTSALFGGLSGSLPESSPMSISFTRNQAIEASDTLYLAIIGRVRERDKTAYFQLGIDEGGWIDARDQSSSNIVIRVLDAEGKSIEPIFSKAKQVLPQSAYSESDKPYLTNCPNPFGGSGKEETTIIYYLSEDTDVHFRLYTLLGERVWERSYASTSLQGAEGLHSGDVTWSGENDAGLDVLNGVYILVMETGSGHVSKRKIAVVR